MHIYTHIYIYIYHTYIYMLYLFHVCVKKFKTSYEYNIIKYYVNTFCLYRLMDNNYVLYKSLTLIHKGRVLS